jgi:hypothetical protein
MLLLFRIKTKDCDLNIKTDEIEFKKILVGLKALYQSIASGKIEVMEDQLDFYSFLSIFR